MRLSQLSKTFAGLSSKTSHHEPARPLPFRPRSSPRKNVMLSPFPAGPRVAATFWPASIATATLKRKRSRSRPAVQVVEQAEKRFAASIHAQLDRPRRKLG
jgi:hypothetical protein